jgi:uroporphyrinogen-III synthase
LRAIEDAERSAGRLRERGYASVIAPVTRVRATSAEIPQGGFDVAVATSAKALEVLSAAGRDAISALPLFVVGGQTLRAAAARDLGVEVSASDAAALAERLRERLAPGSRILYLAGRDRKSGLEHGLAFDGCRVTTIEVYAAQARPAWSPSEARALASCDAALHYSTRSAELALHLAAGAGIGEGFRMLLHVCISEDTAAPLRRSGAMRVNWAATPDEDALLSALGGALGAGAR